MGEKATGTIKRVAVVVGLIMLALVLLVLPSVLRWLLLYDGQAEPREVSRPDLGAVAVPTPAMPSFADEVRPTARGTILVDRAHANNFQAAELNVLQTRLSARSQRVEWVDSAEDLPGQLRYASALVVISAQESWTADEIQAVGEFVSGGGRLLLVADATRYGFLYDEYGTFLGLDHDAAYMNQLASPFGVVFQPDYLYNTSDNVGSYRNVRLTDLAESPLTRGLEQVVFYASRSILSQESALIRTGGATRSSSSEREGPLAVAVAAQEGRVVALADLTFMTEPFNAVADNDRLIANLADFLSGAVREYDLTGFPFFFGSQVDLVYAGDPELDSDLLASGSSLQALLEQFDRQLTVRQAEDKSRDTLFLGLYSETEEVQSYLATAGVTLSLTVTTEIESDEDGQPEASEEVTATEVLTPEHKSRIQIESAGEMVITGTSLLLLESPAERQVLVLLANTQAGLEDALQRLSDGDLTDCLLSEPETLTPTLLALCPTGEVEPGEGGGGWKKGPAEEAKPEAGEKEAEEDEVVEETPEPEVGPRKTVLIVSLDEGEGRYDGLTGADDFEAVLGEAYEVTVLSQKDEGLLEFGSETEYDLVVFTSGDIEGSFGDEALSTAFFMMAAGTPVILSGAYIGEVESESIQRDLLVQDASHAITKGFSEDEVIAFVAAPSGEEYSIAVRPQPDAGEAEVPLVRGPDSEDSGAPAVLAVQDEMSGTGLVLFGFPIYLLPEEAKARLVLNSVEWLLASAEAEG